MKDYLGICFVFAYSILLNLFTLRKMKVLLVREILIFFLNMYQWATPPGISASCYVSSLSIKTLTHSPFAFSAMICVRLSPPEMASMFPSSLQLTFDSGTFPSSLNSCLFYQDFFLPALLPLTSDETHSLQVPSSEQLAIISL